MDELDRLRALEREIEREWWWLNGALHAIAQVSSGDPGAYWQKLPSPSPLASPRGARDQGNRPTCR